jgi:hypothetical protein
LRGGVGDGAVPELRVQVLLERVVEAVREPRGGLLAGEAAGARAVAVGGRRRPVVRLGLRDDAPVVPQKLDEVVVRAAGAIGGSTRKSASVQGGPSINQWTRKESSFGGGGEWRDRILTRWASSDSPPPTSHCRPSRQDFEYPENNNASSLAGGRPVARTAGVSELTKTRNFRVEAEPKEKVKEEEKEKKMDKKGEEKRSYYPARLRNLLLVALLMNTDD